MTAVSQLEVATLSDHLFRAPTLRANRSEFKFQLLHLIYWANHSIFSPEKWGIMIPTI